MHKNVEILKKDNSLYQTTSNLQALLHIPFTLRRYFPKLAHYYKFGKIIIDFS